MSDRMRSRKLHLAVLLAAMFILSVTSASYEGDYVKRLLNKRWQWKMARRASCLDSAGKCFTSAECCEGLVCAAIDDYLGQQPEAPGYCVKEKELQTCSSATDCPSGARCLTLGRTGEGYCVPSNGLSPQHRHQVQAPFIKNSESGSTESATGGLGDECSSSADCRATSGFSQTKLCCQDVRRGRQGIRRICDRVSAISVCV